MVALKEHIDHGKYLYLSLLYSTVGTFGGAIGRASFNEPEDSDETSAPSEQGPTQAAPVQSLQNPVAKLLARPKKKQRSPAALQAAIARARRARPSSMKWG